MRKLMFSAIAVLFVLSMASPAKAQAQHTPRGKATDISKAEIEATVQKTASAPVSDQQIRVMNINGDYNVGVGVVHRAKTAAGCAAASVVLKGKAGEVTQLSL